MPDLPPTHRPPRAGLPAARDSSARRGYDAAWRRLSEHVRRSRPVCERCGRRPSECVDHVVSLARGGARYDPANLMALCWSCHSQKTAEQDGSFGRRPKEQP